MKKILSFFAIVMLVSVFAVNLMAQPPHYNYNTNGTNNSFPLGIAGGKNAQWLILAGTFSNPTPAPAGNITTFWFRVGDTYPINATFTTFELKLAQANITALPAGAYHGPMTTVFANASYVLAAPGGTWVQITLDAPFYYNPAQALIIEMGHCGGTGITGFPMCTTTLTGNMRNWSVGGCPFAFSGVSTSTLNCGVTISQLPQYYNFDNGTSSNSFPFNMAAGKAVNSLFPAGAFVNPTPLPTGKAITRVYFRTSTAGTRTYTTLQIKMAQSTITDLTSGEFYAGPWETVYDQASATLTSTAGGWMAVTLDNYFNYDPAKSLIIFVGHCSATGSGASVYNSAGSGIKRTWSVGGCPFAPYAGGDNSTLNFGVDVISNVGVIPDEIVTQENLIQNFPNPFNNYTTISYQLKENSNVVLKVYDIMGKEVSTLVNKSQTAGKYEVKFDAINLSSGIYMYQLTTNSGTETKRMMIEK
jgi:hypothetical protein